MIGIAEASKRSAPLLVLGALLSLGSPAAAQDVAPPSTPEAATDSDTDTDTDTDTASDSDSASDPDSDSDSPSTLGWTDGRALAWTLFTTSFLVTVGGGIIVAVGVDDLNAVENASDGTRWADVEEAYGRAPILTGVGFAVLALGLVGMTIGTVLLAVHGEGGTWIEASVGPGSVRLRGRF